MDLALLTFINNVFKDHFGFQACDFSKDLTTNSIHIDVHRQLDKKNLDFLCLGINQLSKFELHCIVPILDNKGFRLVFTKCI